MRCVKTTGRTHEFHSSVINLADHVT